jgi:hypothetical protein
MDQGLNGHVGVTQGWVPFYQNHNPSPIMSRKLENWLDFGLCMYCSDRQHDPARSRAKKGDDMHLSRVRMTLANGKGKKIGPQHREKPGVLACSLIFPYSTCAFSIRPSCCRYISTLRYLSKFSLRQLRLRFRASASGSAQMSWWSTLWMKQPSSWWGSRSATS